MLTPFHYFLLAYNTSSRQPFFEVLIPTPVPAHVRLPEYFTAEHTRPPFPNFADYPICIGGITNYDPNDNPRFPILTERFIEISIHFRTGEEKWNSKEYTSLI